MNATTLTPLAEKRREFDRQRARRKADHRAQYGSSTHGKRVADILAERMDEQLDAGNYDEFALELITAREAFLRRTESDESEVQRLDLQRLYEEVEALQEAEAALWRQAGKVRVLAEELGEELGL